MKIVKFAMLIILLIFLGGCAQNEKSDEQKPEMTTSFTATVVSVEEERFFATGTDGTFDEIYINVTDGTTITLKDGSKGVITDLKEGDKIKVEFNGMVATSQPPQITAMAITLE